MNLSEMQEIEPTGKIEPRLPEPDKKIVFYKRTGFKRVTGSIIMVIGGILSIIPKTSFLGQGLFYAGSALLGVGAIHAHQKNKQNISVELSGFAALVFKVSELLKRFKK
jgi:curli biogenesis system outer membrane secretion channel CsgG